MSPAQISATSRPTVFISYPHGAPTTNMAQLLYAALTAAKDGLGIDVFMDENGIEPADLFDSVIVGALEETTHFIALLNNRYWLSSYCRKELASVLGRFENDRSVRVLFVKAGPIDEKLLTFDRDREQGRLKTDDPLVKRVGDLQFLGPFDSQHRLQVLARSGGKLDDQIAALVRRLERVLPRREEGPTARPGKNTEHDR